MVGYGLSGNWDVGSTDPLLFAHEASHLLMLGDTAGPNASPTDITNDNAQGGRYPALSPTAQPSNLQIQQILRNNPPATVEW